MNLFPDVKLFTCKRYEDARGFFSETFNPNFLADLGIRRNWVQDNHSLSHQRGVIRGLHLQRPPRAQAKLVRVARGSIFDVVVDLRRDSPTYGRHDSTMLSAAAWNQVFVPEGFAHGFCTLEPETEVIYKVSDFYSPEHEVTILWNDPALGIEWPVPADAVQLSPKDAAGQRLADIPAIAWTP